MSAELPSVDANDLPDFDLEEDTSSSATELSGGDMSLNNSAKNSVTMDLNDPKVLDAMKGTSKKRGDRISKALTRDQELEKRFQFAGKEIKDPTLPTNLASIRSESGTKQTVGKKAARNEARRRAAIEAKESENDAESFLSKLPVGQKDGKLNYLKLVEQGTWAGIFLLVAWEVYINTPIFNRAAPLSPVVFESPDQLFLP